MKLKRAILILLLLASILLLTGCAGNKTFEAPGVTLSVEPGGKPKEVSTGIQLLVILTVLTLAPTIIIMATSFTRIVVVLALLRNAIGTPSIPPSQVMTGLALLLTFFIMAPVYNKINDNAMQPYLDGKIDQEKALSLAQQPLRDFMFSQTREKDISLFMELNKQPKPKSLDDIPTIILLPAFVINELRIAFMMGFVIYVPFLVIDIVISSLLLAMGMMMLPPTVVSLPFKLLLFVMVDGWYLITRSLTLSFFH
jgi:flagellar biosynthesis protein FliP